MGADGLVRIVLCLMLAVIGVEAVGWYGMAVAIAPLLGVVYIASRKQLSTEPGPDATWHEVTPNLGWLLLGSVCRRRPRQRRPDRHEPPRTRPAQTTTSLGSATA